MDHTKGVDEQPIPMSKIKLKHVNKYQVFDKLNTCDNALKLHTITLINTLHTASYSAANDGLSYYRKENNNWFLLNKIKNM